jgi:hypothetical protein
MTATIDGLAERLAKAEAGIAELERRDAPVMGFVPAGAALAAALAKVRRAREASLRLAPVRSEPQIGRCRDSGESPTSPAPRSRGESPGEL